MAIKTGYTTVNLKSKAKNGEPGDPGADGVQDNLFGYDCVLGGCTNTSNIVVHTKTGCASFISRYTEDFVYVDIVRAFISGTKYAVTGKLSVPFTPTKLVIGFRDSSYYWIVSAEATLNSDGTFVAQVTATDKCVCMFIQAYCSTSSSTGIFEISNMKIEDASALTGISTAFNGLAEDSVKQGDNMLTNTNDFSADWAQGGGYALSLVDDDILKGNKAIYYKGGTYEDESGNAYHMMAIQNVTGLKANTWYTYSVWMKGSGVATTWVRLTGSNGAGFVYCDEEGAVVTSGNPTYNHTMASDWKLHTLKFRTPSNVSSSASYQLDCTIERTYNTSAYEYYFAMPKLEECEKATDWCVGVSQENALRIAHQMRDRGTWDGTQTYYNNDAYVDYVLYNNTYYIVRDGIGSFSSETTPNNDIYHWKEASMQQDSFTVMGFLLTDQIKTKIFQAVEAQIDSLWTKKLQTLSSNGASITIENGLIQVFGTHNKLLPNIEFGVDDAGYAVLKYFDNKGNELYNLGPDGLAYATRETYAKYTDYKYYRLNYAIPKLSDSLEKQYHLDTSDDYLIYLWQQGSKHYSSSSKALYYTQYESFTSGCWVSEPFENTGKFATEKINNTMPTSLFTGILIFDLTPIGWSSAGRKWYGGTLFSIANGIIQDRCQVRFYRESNMSFAYKLCNFSNVVYDVTQKTWQNYINDMNAE